MEEEEVIVYEVRRRKKSKKLPDRRSATYVTQSGLTYAHIRLPLWLAEMVGKPEDFQIYVVPLSMLPDWVRERGEVPPEVLEEVKKSKANAIIMVPL